MMLDKTSIFDHFANVPLRLANQERTGQIGEVRSKDTLEFPVERSLVDLDSASG